MSEVVQTKVDNPMNVLKRRSMNYNRYGKYLVKDFNYKTLFLRLVGQLGDVIIMILPIIIWVDLFLLVTSGVFSVKVLYASMNIVMFLILITTVVGNTVFTILFKGQSFGKMALRTKVVTMQNNEVENSLLIVRESIGKQIPLIILFILFGLYGVLAFLLVNGLSVLIDKQHRSLIDFALKTKVIMLDEKGMLKQETKVVEEKPVALVKGENQVDLHLNSSFSHDGEYSVEDLCKQAKKVGLQVISICDHNSVKANLIAQRVAPLYGLEYIAGVNIDCNYKGVHVRLLGYFIDSNDQRYATIEYENLAKEKAVSLRRIQLLEELLGITIDQDKLMKYNRFQVVSADVLARYVLTNVDFQEIPVLQPYLKGNRKHHPIQSFVDDFFGEGKVAYVPIVHPDLEDMIAVIKATKGVSVLAHPMHSLRQNLPYLQEIINLGIDGLEVFNPRHSIEDCKYLVEVAKENKLGMSSGSEYHGEKKKEFMLGKTNCPIKAEIIVRRFIDKHQPKVEAIQAD